MDVKEAVAKAKAYVGELFQPEGASDVLLEEVDYEDEKREWRITVSFVRPERGVPGPGGAVLESLSSLKRVLGPFERALKVVHIEDATGRVRLVRDRLVGTAA